MTQKVVGRGAIENRSGRFEPLQTVPDPENFQDPDGEETSPLQTQFFKDASRTIINKNNSPDIGFKYSLNFYRGCEHGCAYCYARPTHEYLGLSAGLDFESKIFVKENAPEQLRKELMSPRWQPECIHISGVTDCYQPAERRFQLTRRCLQVLAEFKNPVSLITKNYLITRDIELLKELAKDNLVIVYLSVTTLNKDLARKMEPRTSTPAARLKAVEELSRAGIPVGVNVAPVIPGLTDHEMPNILKSAKEAGADFAGYTLVRLPHSVSTIFSEWLEQNQPDAKSKILNQIRHVRSGKLNDPRFGSRMRGSGLEAENVRKIFEVFTKRLGLNERKIVLRTDQFSRPGEQLTFYPLMKTSLDGEGLGGIKGFGGMGSPKDFPSAQGR